MRQSLLNILFSLLLILWGAVIPAFAASARLYGDVTLGMADYRAEEAGVEVEKVSSMQQQYTLTAEKKGLLGDNRLGSYTLLLGYEFTALDAERSELGVRDAAPGKVEAGKVYYNANLLLAPGGLPFRLSLFAQDLKRTSFSNKTFASLRLGDQRVGRFKGHLVDSEVPVDLLNGSHQVFGATLLLGIRNGSYLGLYRDSLSQLPRLLIDYKQEDVKDLHGIFSQTHYRNRDLAFVSLNKKDNWVHVRLREYTDFLNEDSNRSRAMVMIGTIDHQLSRQWINLTNWIKISGDLSHAVEKESYWLEPKKTYTINLLAFARRDKLNGNFFSNFERENNGSLLTSTAELPIAVNFERDRDTLIRTRLITEASQRTLLQGRLLNADEDLNRTVDESKSFYLDVNADLRRTRQIIVKPRIEIEVRNEGAGHDGEAVRLGGELASSTRGNKGVSWLAGYSLTYMQSTQGATSGNYLQNDLYGRIDKDMNSNLRIGGYSKLAMGKGHDAVDLPFRIPKMAQNVFINGSDGDDGLLTIGSLNLYLDHRYRQLGNRLEFDFELTSGSGNSVTESMLQHRLSYQQLAHKLDWESEIAFGSQRDNSPTVDLDFVQQDRVSNEANLRTSWHSRSTYRYVPSRNTALTLSGDVNSAPALTYTLSEELSYSIYTSNGIIRRLAEFTERIDYEKVSQSAGSRDSALLGSFSATYYPSKYLYCKASSEVVSYLGRGALQQANSAEIGVGFEKLKFLANYSRGKKNRESDDLPEVMEQRWDLKVKKIF